MLAASPQVYLRCLSISPSRAPCERLRLAPPFSPAMRDLWFGEPPRPEPLALGHTLQHDVCSTVSHDPVMNVHVRKHRPSSSALLLSIATSYSAHSQFVPYPWRSTIMTSPLRYGAPGEPSRGRCEHRGQGYEEWWGWAGFFEPTSVPLNIIPQNRPCAPGRGPCHHWQPAVWWPGPVYALFSASPGQRNSQGRRRRFSLAHARG